MAKTALCVGINDYPGTGSDLFGCVNDAIDWAAALERRGYAVRLVCDRDATREAMVGSLERLVRDAAGGDFLAFTYSGHGSWLPDEDGDEADHRDETLCPHDVADGQYVIDDDLATIFGGKPRSARLFFIADSCHSGTVSRWAPPSVDAAGNPVRPRFLPPGNAFGDARRISRMRALETRPIARQKYPALLVAGCGDAEYSYDAWFGGRANGAFTHTALRALRGEPATPRAWMAAIREKLPTADHPQTPRLYGSSSARGGPML